MQGQTGPIVRARFTDGWDLVVVGLATEASLEGALEGGLWDRF